MAYKKCLSDKVEIVKKNADEAKTNAGKRRKLCKDRESAKKVIPVTSIDQFSCRPSFFSCSLVTTFFTFSL